LHAFATASKRSEERIYLDLFAGTTENRDRKTGELIIGSAQIALATDPPFTRIHLFELPANASRLETELRAQFRGRSITVHPGDSNSEIGRVLRNLHDLRWAPTFAFIDPNGPDFHWDSLIQLAAFRADQKTKVELWLLLPVDLFVRTLPVDGGHVREADASRISRMYGTEDWRYIYDARLRGALAASDARDEYVNLMRFRLERRLGYSWTHPFEVANEAGRPIYHMLFATDHPAGTTIMTDIYNKAATEFPAMRKLSKERLKQARDAETGVLSLFSPEELAQLVVEEHGPATRYRYEPPWQPFWVG